MGPPLTLFEDPAAWARAGAEALAADLIAALDAGAERALLAAAGGATPGPILAALAQIEAPGLVWDRVTVTPTDERLAPPGSPARNLTALEAAFAARAARHPGFAVRPLEALGAPPAPAAVLLGFGLDAHVASIFPAGDGMAAARAAPAPPAVLPTTPDPLPPEAPFPRLTLNFSALLCAPRVVIAAKGAAKLAVWRRAAADGGASPLGAVLAQTQTPTLTLILTAA